MAGPADRGSISPLEGGELTGRAAVVLGDGAFARAIRQLLADRGARLEPELPENPGCLDILVLVAPEPSGRPISETDPEQFTQGVGATLKTAYLGLKHGVEAIRRGGPGRGAVVFVAPGCEGRSLDATQSGLRLLARAAALELGPERIRVNFVVPGSVAEAAPLGRALEASDVARAVLFAASDRSKFMTGADVVVDGGRMIT